MSKNNQMRFHYLAVVVGIVATMIYFCLTFGDGSAILCVMRILFAGIATVSFGVGMYFDSIEGEQMGFSAYAFAIGILAIIVSLERLMESIG